MTTVMMLVMIVFSLFVGYKTGINECNEYKASIQLEKAIDRINELEYEKTQSEIKSACHYKGC